MYIYIYTEKGAVSTPEPAFSVPPGSLAGDTAALPRRRPRISRQPVCSEGPGPESLFGIVRLAAGWTQGCPA